MLHPCKILLEKFGVCVKEQSFEDVNERHTPRILGEVRLLDVSQISADRLCLPLQLNGWHARGLFPTYLVCFSLSRMISFAVRRASSKAAAIRRIFTSPRPLIASNFI